MAASDLRGNTRVPLDLEIDYSDLETFCQDYIRNISRGGLFIETKNPLELNTELKLKFRLPGCDAPIKATGVVVWTVEPEDATANSAAPGMGVRFGDLSEHDMSMIDSMVKGEMDE